MATRWHSDPRVRALMGIQHLQALQQIVLEPDVMREWQRLLETAEETRQEGVGTLEFLMEFYHTPNVWGGLTVTVEPSNGNQAPASPAVDPQLADLHETMRKIASRLDEMDSLMLEIMERRTPGVETPAVEPEPEVHVPPSPFPPPRQYEPSVEAQVELRQRTEEARRVPEEGHPVHLPFPGEGGVDRIPGEREVAAEEPERETPDGEPHGPRYRPGVLKRVNANAIDAAGLKRDLYRVAHREGVPCSRCESLLQDGTLVTRGKQGSPLCAECRPFHVPREVTGRAVR